MPVPAVTLTVCDVPFAHEISKSAERVPCAGEVQNACVPVFRTDSPCERTAPVANEYESDWYVPEMTLAQDARHTPVEESQVNPDAQENLHVHAVCEYDQEAVPAEPLIWAHHWAFAVSKAVPEQVSSTQEFPPDGT